MKHTIVDKARLLRGVPFLSGVPTEVLADLAALSSVEAHAADELLFADGDPADAFYVVVEGAVKATRRDGSTFRRAAGEDLGALDVLDERPRGFTAISETAVLLRVGAEDFLYLLEQYPALARGVIRHLAFEVRKQTQGAVAPAPGVPE